MKISNKRKIEELRPLHNVEIIRRDDNSIYERFKIGKTWFYKCLYFRRAYGRSWVMRTNRKRWGYG